MYYFFAASLRVLSTQNFTRISASQAKQTCRPAVKSIIRNARTGSTGRVDMYWNISVRFYVHLIRPCLVKWTLFLLTPHLLSIPKRRVVYQIVWSDPRFFIMSYITNRLRPINVSFVCLIVFIEECYSSYEPHVVACIYCVLAGYDQRTIARLGSAFDSATHWNK